MSTISPKSKFLFAFYSVRPAIESYWEKTRLGQFTNQLPSNFVAIDEKIQDILCKEPDHGMQFKVGLNNGFTPDSFVTPREFLVHIFGLKQEVSSRDNETVPHHLNLLIDEAEKLFLRHIVRDVNRSASFITNGGAYKLRMSNIFSTRTDLKGDFPSRRKFALFTISNYETELEAANVPRFYCRNTEDFDTERIVQLYRLLPQSIKDLFFRVSWRGQFDKNLPLYLMRDAMCFANDEKWEELKKACSSSRGQANEVCTEFLRDFLAFERESNGFSLGAPRTNRDSGKKLGPRELSYLDFIRPSQYIGQIQKKSTSFDDE